MEIGTPWSSAVAQNRSNAGCAGALPEPLREHQARGSLCDIGERRELSFFDRVRGEGRDGNGHVLEVLSSTLSRNDDLLDGRSRNDRSGRSGISRLRIGRAIVSLGGRKEPAQCKGTQEERLWRPLVKPSFELSLVRFVPHAAFSRNLIGLPKVEPVASGNVFPEDPLSRCFRQWLDQPREVFQVIVVVIEVRKVRCPEEAIGADEIDRAEE